MMCQRPGVRGFVAREMTISWQTHAFLHQQPGGEIINSSLNRNCYSINLCFHIFIVHFNVAYVVCPVFDSFLLHNRSHFPIVVKESLTRRELKLTNKDFIGKLKK